MSGIGCVILIGTYGIELVKVDGYSMAPTLGSGDLLLVNRMDYELGDPQIGDIVMLDYPLNPAKAFLKRVIAKGGDTVRVTAGHAYVNDELVRDDYVPETFRSYQDCGPERVEPGYYFVMGDHRNDSWDSRQWGFVPRRYILGKVTLRWWPIVHARVF
jgi:signal peptidase I